MWYDVIAANQVHKMKGDQLILKNCPKCGNDRFNFEISKTKKVAHCWVCDLGCGIRELARLLNITIDDLDNWQLTSSPIAPVPALLDISSLQRVSFEEHKEFLISKGLTAEDLKLYNILTGSSFKHKLVIPLHEGQKLVYYAVRDMITGRYCNPAIPKGSLLPYYLGTLDRMTLYLVEGAFDGISVNKLGYSAGVLLGTSISEEQMVKIRAFGFMRVVVALDGDVWKKALDMYDKLSYRGFNASIVRFEKDEDPNDLYVKNPKFLKLVLDKATQLTTMDRIAT